MDHGTDFWSNLFNTDFEVEFLLVRSGFLARNSVRKSAPVPISKIKKTILGRFGFEIRTFLKSGSNSGLDQNVSIRSGPEFFPDLKKISNFGQSQNRVNPNRHQLPTSAVVGTSALDSFSN